MTFKKQILFLTLLLAAQIGFAQGPLITKSSVTTFFSHAPLEDIEAVNKQTTAALDLEKGEIVVKMLIKHFEFEKALMQEHFNENYMESEKFPSSVFKGKFSGSPIDLNTDGAHEVDVNGELTIHGITLPVECKASIDIRDRQVSAQTKFMVRPEDYGIKIPSVVVDNIAEEVEVTSQLTFNAENN